MAGCVASALARCWRRCPACPRRMRPAPGRRSAEPLLRGPSARLSGAVGRRRTRHGAHRRAPGHRGAQGPHRLHRRHEHGRRGGRAVCERHERRADRVDHALGQLAGGVSRRAAAARSEFPAQAGRPQFSGAPAARAQALPHSAAQGIHPGPDAAGDAAPADAAIQQQHELRSAADAVSRRGHRLGDRRCRAARERRSVDRDAREHLRARRVRSGRLSGAAAGRRRHRGESPHRRGARDARGHPHRVGRELPAAAARSARHGAVHLQPDARHHGAQERGPPEGQPWRPRTFSSSPRSGPRRPPTSRLAASTILQGEAAARGGRAAARRSARRAMPRTKATWRGARPGSPGCP